MLFAAVLPAEYGIDPTGLGSALGLTKMGQLKMQLAKEAQEATLREANAARITNAPLTADTGIKNDSMVVEIGAGESIEVKLAMLKGQRAEYTWQADSGEVYYDLHGHTLKLPRMAPHRYSEGTLRGAQGEIAAEFNGVHGWYFENRSDRTLRIVVKAWGRYQSMIEM